MYNFQNIPDELTRLNQWVVWKYEQTDDGKQTKILYNPAGGWRASTTDARTWDTFANAVRVYENSNGTYAGIGFVFTNFDEYCGIDLDSTEDQEAYARQVKVYEALNSYSELSPSGKGLHIIVKATIPHGRKRSFIEVYSWGRFFTFTGNVFGPTRPIEDRQETVMRLWEEMGEHANEIYFAGDAAPRMFDDELIPKMEGAFNGQHFKDLFTGNWQIHGYPSQSEADQALMNFIIFHTKNRAQAMRIFRMSALGQRDKAQRDKYLEYTMNRAFDLTLPPIDVSAIIDQANAAIAARNAARPVLDFQPTAPEPGHSAPPARFDGFDLDMWRNIDPPGLLRDIADFVFQAAPRPIKEIALATALGIMAGVCGRAFNYSGTGLNLYIMMLAETGRGKEAMSSGATKLFTAVVGNNEYPSLWHFLGPSNMASGSGLLKDLVNSPQPSMISITGEVGKRMQQMSAQGANIAEKQLERVLLDLYGKSGAGQVLLRTSYSDKSNNIEMMHSPAFSWLGEGTPSSFYEALNETQISSGLLPRFIVLEYTGPRPELNERSNLVHPSQNLLSRFRDLATISLQANQKGDVINVNHSPDAADKLRLFNIYCDHKINSTDPSSPTIQLWNRAHLKVLRISALLAIAHNHQSAVIDGQMVDWAISLVMCDVLNLVGKFERDEIGSGLGGEAIRLIAQSIIKVAEDRVKLKPQDARYASDRVISRSLLMTMTASYKLFKDNGRLFNDTIEELIKLGALNRLSPGDTRQTYGTSAQLFQVSDMSFFSDRVPVR